MQREIITKLSVFTDTPTSEATRINGANINCVAFNMDLIAKEDHALFLRIWEMFHKAKKLRRRHGQNSN